MIKMQNGNSESIYDIAAATGFSSSTVSRVLNGKSNTSEKSRKIILEAAQKMNFRLRTSVRRTTIGLLLDVVEAPQGYYIDAMLCGLVAGSAKAGINVEIFTRDNYQTMLSSKLDGVIAHPWDAASARWLNTLKGMPMILLNGKPSAIGVAVCSDHYQSGAMAAEYLLGRGCKKIAIISDNDDYCNLERIRGFKDSFKKNTGCELPAELSRICIWRQYSDFGNHAGDFIQLLQRHPDGVFLAGEDRLQVHWNIIQSMNLQVHRDIEVIAMEHPVIAPLLAPQIDTIAQPLRRLHQMALEIIIKLMNGEARPKTEALPNSYIMRYRK